MLNKEIVVFIILNYMTWGDSVKCVDSIIETYKYPKKILVVDNASPNCSFSCLNDWFQNRKYSDVEIIRSEYNGGFSYGNNFGYNYMNKKYQFKYVFFSNSDIIFLPFAIERMVRVLLRKTSAIQSAPMVYDLGNEPTTLPLKKNRGILRAFGFRSHKDVGYKPEELEGLKQVYLVSGCCFAVNKYNFDKIGGFDENVFMYNEENIISKKADRYKLSIWFEPNSKVVHNQGGATRKKSIFVDKEFLKSSLYYYRKYERKNIVLLVILWNMFMLKILLKIVLHRYQNSKGFLACLKETFISLVRLVSF